MCELLGQRLDREDSQAFFTIGLFSVLDAVLSCPMADILKELPLSEHVKGALIDREGAMGETLRCTIAYEEGNWQDAHCLQVRPADIREAYLEAVKWVETDQGVRGILNAGQESSENAELATADRS
jgi:EAL and modified HD-GYP domain-containing signal transduction protein